MATTLRTLVVEDSEEDALLLLHELRRGGYDVESVQVSTPEAMRAALARPWDVVISDWSMPRFDALAAFKIVRELALDLPFIIVSGTISEDIAVHALKAGVHDFMIKGKYARLLPSIARELREAEVRRRQREGEEEIERQRTQIARSEERYRSMFKNSPVPMWTYDRETLRFVAVNDAALRMYGYERAEFLGMTIADLRLDQAEAEPRAGSKICRHRRQDGAPLTVEIETSDLFVDGSDVRLAVINDVTERERAQAALRITEDQLRQAQKMEAIGQLAGSVAHDFNNVLTVIQSYAYMLEETLEGDPRCGDATEVRRASERAAAITRQLLTLSRHGIVAPRSIALDQVITAFLPMLQRLVGERVSIATHLADVPPIIADPGQLEQVLMNLAVNARDAMPEGGRLTIETNVLDVDDEGAAIRGLASGRYVVVAVTDAGTGMDAATQRRIFDPFFTTKPEGKGTGLGLSIVHGIVAQAGGTVTVYSEPGHGTTFRVHLPVAHETVAAPRVEASIAPRTLPPITVLVVDDQPEVRGVAARILHAAGCEVIEAATAEEARRTCVSHDGALDVVLLDVVLGDGRGDLVARQLRELRPGIQVVMMSGYSAGALGPTGAPPPDLLPKPFGPSELRAAIARRLVVRSDEGAPATPPPVAAPATADQARILVADDDEGLRRSICRVLRRADFTVVEVASGSQAIAALEGAPFDVILSDVHMPDGSGLDLVRAVRRIDLDVPVILMSGQPDVETASLAVEYGVFRYLTKPVENDVLTRTARHAARVHALARLRREAFTVSGAHAGAVDRAGLEVRFDQAIDSLWMAFQPIFTVAGAVSGVEALLRSSEPSMAGPQHILDAATQLGRLPHVGRRVRALSAAAVAPRSDGLQLFVNLHPEDLADVELVDELAPLTQIAKRVILEVTERASLGNSQQLITRLARLRELGFRLAVDDIGAGYSGLTSFTQLMPEIVKIDMSLVRDVNKSALKQRTIGALCKLCHEFGCQVVGEGVETVEERDCLIAMGCDLLQGYLLGRPVRELPSLA